MVKGQQVRLVFHCKAGSMFDYMLAIRKYPYLPPDTISRNVAGNFKIYFCQTGRPDGWSK